jgi:hypothetical protein
MPGSTARTRVRARRSLQQRVSREHEASCYCRTLRVRARLNRVQQLHVRNVVDVDFLLEHDDEPPPVELDGEDRRREEQLADGRLPLGMPESAPLARAIRESKARFQRLSRPCAAPPLGHNRPRSAQCWATLCAPDRNAAARPAVGTRSCAYASWALSLKLRREPAGCLLADLAQARAARQNDRRSRRGSPE